MKTDEHFVHEAAIGSMAEVELGKLAMEKSSDAKVKALGQRMVTDHSKASDELESLAAKKDIELPKEIDSEHKATIDRLSKLSGEDFDRAYVSDMLKDHQADISAFRQQSESGQDAEIKAWAAKTLPTLQDHLRAVQDASRALGN
jgi:putative membrane protein